MVAHDDDRGNTLYDCRDWSAWYDRMPGSGEPDPNLHVAGVCTLPSGSCTWTLEPGNEGTVEEPDLFVLALRVDCPEVGDAQVVDREMTWTGDAGPGIRRVRVQGDALATFEVTEAY